MNVIDVAQDARDVFEIMMKGGVTLIPVDTGYGLTSIAPAASDLVFNTKGRGTHKRQSIIANQAMQRELLQLDSRAQDIVDTIVEGFELPVGVLGTYNPDHPMLRGMDDDTRRKSTAFGKIAMLVNAGPMHRELCKLSHEHNVPIFGSSANLTGTGARFRVDEIAPEILAIADHVIDYGTCKYRGCLRSGTIIDFSSMEVIRMGARYDQIKDICKRFFDIDLPEDPGVEARPSGHVNEMRLAGVE